MRGVYVISVAAHLVGAHPQTLRSWERVGLVVPTRSAGGQRRYSDADLSRLTQIMALSAQGIAPSGIARILALETEIEQLRARLVELESALRPPQDPNEAGAASP